MTYERVHTVWNYHDGPREGLADYGGKPHWYRCEWNEATDDWAETFELTPVDAQTFRWAMEQWEIWRTWERAFHSGQASKESHPGFRNKNQRFDALGKLIDLRMLSMNPLAIHPKAHFRPLPGQKLPGSMLQELEVQWGLPRA
jgi:hypothetical protein